LSNLFKPGSFVVNKNVRRDDHKFNTLEKEINLSKGISMSRNGA
jgi:hypothetical protein